MSPYPLKTKAENKEGGFIALTATIILTIVLMMLIFANNTSSYFARFDALGSENKRVSSGLSEACTNAALLKLGQDYSFNPNNKVEDIDATVPDYKCTIESITCLNGCGATDPKKTVSIKTSAQYPSINGSWSTTTIQAVVQNPNVSTTDPVCSMGVTPTSVATNLPVTVSWLASSNTNNFTVTYQGNTKTYEGSNAQSGNDQFPDANGFPSPGTVTFTGTATSASGASGTCSKTLTITAPPPAPSCADTVIMLDRTGSMFYDYSHYPPRAAPTQWIADEKSAAKGLASLYQGIIPHPQLSVGHFADKAYTQKDENKTSAEIVSGGQLASSDSYYAGLPSLIDTALQNITGQFGPTAYTNLSDAISKAANELNSARHISTNKKVLILVSDGGPNVPPSNPEEAALDSADSAKRSGVNIFTIHFGDTSGQNLLAELASGGVDYPSDAGPFSPSTTSIVPPSPGWNNPTNAYSINSIYTTAVNFTGAKQSYGFNIPSDAIPAGSPISDVQLTANVGTAILNTTVKPIAEGSYTSWNANVGTKVTSVQNQDTAYINPSTTGNVAETYVISNVVAGTIPMNAVITSVDLHALVANTSNRNQTNLKLRVEKSSGVVSDDSGYKMGPNSYGPIIRAMPTNPFTGKAWTVVEVTNWPVRFGVVRNSSQGSPQVDQLYVTVNYKIPATNCQFGIQTSWDSGVTWGNEQEISVPDSITPLTFSANLNGGWGHTFTSSDMTSTNFRALIHAISLPGNSCDPAAATAVDSLQLTVKYAPHEKGSDNQFSGDASKENADDDYFFIAPQSSDLQGIFKTIGEKVCPALAPACSNGIDDDGDGFTDFPDDKGCTDKNDNDEWEVPLIPPLVLPPLAPISINSWYELPH